MLKKEIIIQRENDIKNMKIKVGNKSFYFKEAYPDYLVFTTKISGLDISKLSEPKIYIKYENLNPAVENQIIRKLMKRD